MLEPSLLQLSELSQGGLRLKSSLEARAEAGNDSLVLQAGWFDATLLPRVPLAGWVTLRELWDLSPAASSSLSAPGMPQVCSSAGGFGSDRVQVGSSMEKPPQHPRALTTTPKNLGWPGARVLGDPVQIPRSGVRKRGMKALPAQRRGWSSSSGQAAGLPFRAGSRPKQFHADSRTHNGSGKLAGTKSVLLLC